MNYTYSDYNVSQIRLWRNEKSSSTGIALYNKRKDRVYIHCVKCLTDEDINAIREFIVLMKQGVRE